MRERRTMTLDGKLKTGSNPKRSLAYGTRGSYRRET